MKPKEIGTLCTLSQNGICYFLNISTRTTEWKAPFKCDRRGTSEINAKNNTNMQRISKTPAPQRVLCGI